MELTETQRKWAKIYATHRLSAEYIEALEQDVQTLHKALEDIKAIATQAMTEPTPMPNALTWDCFVRICNAVDHALS